MKLYLTELLNRYEIKGVSLKVEDPELEQLSPEAVKEAQAITGAVLWASTRSRPDLMFITSRMGRWSTKAPSRVKDWGIQALKYTAGTLELGLEFRRDPGPVLGQQDQLALPRDTWALEAYSDASHAPSGGRSVQGTVLLWRGCVILWESSRQAFTTLSSAEAELVAMVYTIQAGESVCPIIEEFLETDLKVSLPSDNAAAISACHPSMGSWRNRESASSDEGSIRTRED